MKCERCGIENNSIETGPVEERRVYSCFSGWIKRTLCLRCYMMWGE